MKASGIILAGGRSSRMKTNKALLKFNNQNMIANVITAIEKEVDEIIIVTNDPMDYLDFNAMLVTDLIPGHGPLSGIHAGLKAATFDYGFVVACDMPFVCSELVQYMLEKASSHEAVVPRQGEYYQPLHAVYSKKCILPIEKTIKMGKRKVTSFYDDIDVYYIDNGEISEFINPDKVFFNINTGEDLQKAREMVGE